jgi:hypothetical protein
MMRHFRSPQARSAVDQLQSHANDVFISTFAKSGTTWMQQIVHQVRCGTDDSFGDIYEVVPWIESAIDMDIDPEGAQPGEFRVFKSHLSCENLPKGGRVICVLRDPLAVVPSWFRFFEGWLFESNSLSLDDFAREFYLPRFDDHAAHFIESFNRLDNSDTLVLCYEDLASNANQVPSLVADFLEVELDDNTLDRVISNCGRDYMYKNRSKFEERLFRKHIDAKFGLPLGGASLKVNQSPTVTSLSNEIKGEIAKLWRDSIQAELGFENYQQYRNALPNPFSSTH